jgi:hypothetical protein
MPEETKPKIDQLLIQSALQPDLCRHLLEAPDEVFCDFELTKEEKEILRRPDGRLLPLLGAALALQTEMGSPPEAPVKASFARVETRTLPDALLALTVVPCAVQENGQFQGLAYAVSVSPLPENGDPAGLPLPAGLPGQPLAPLYAVIQISAVLSQDVAGGLQAGLWASFRRSTNVTAPPPPEMAGDPSSPPFGTRIDSAEVESAAAAVLDASRDDRYDKLVDLLRAVRSGDVR